MSNPSNQFSVLNRGQQFYSAPQVMPKKQERKFWPEQMKEIIQSRKELENVFSDDDDEDDDDVFNDVKSSLKSLDSEKLRKREEKATGKRQVIDTIVISERKKLFEDEEDGQGPANQTSTSNIKSDFQKPASKEQGNASSKQVQSQVPKKKTFLDELEEETQRKKQEEINRKLEKEYLDKYKLEEGILEKEMRDAQNVNLGETSSEEDEDEEEENGSEDSEDSDDSGKNKKSQALLMKPVFINKEQREDLDTFQDEQLRIQKEKERLQLLKEQETQELFNHSIKLEKMRQRDQANISSGEEMPDDNDDINIGLEQQLWSIRELKRLKRDRDEREQYDVERAEIERRRNMTNQEIFEENLKLGIKQEKEKTKYKFLQKYYHKGAFYQDLDEELLNRDFNVAVGEDLVDKSNPELPSILQKRRGQFGKKGQSKYTHLTAEDTTDFNFMHAKDQTILANIKSRMAGLKGQNVLSRKDLTNRK